jgi:5-formaminoimidazole-4-carboxamide-1-(beta)-D-ribofuranosyl 5'-monophosphate synthetase
MNKKSIKDCTIAVIGSHSALDVCRGAKDEGFKTLVVTEPGRDKTYSKYYKSQKGLGCVDEVMEVTKFKDLLSVENQKILLDKNSIFIPHRSFEVYINNYDAIENDFKVPMFGNKKLLRSEERTLKPNQYDILDEAGIKYPKAFKSSKEIDRLVIVKVPEKERGFERAFFLASSEKDFELSAEIMLMENKITKEDLKKAVIEEFVLGVQINFNFFYSTLNNRLELIGTDTRRQTNLDGLLRLPSTYQTQIMDKINLKYEEAGHIAVTSLESLLEPAFAAGDNFVKACKKLFSPGVIGPFSLQSVITAGPPKKEIVVFDVSPRMPGSPGIAATPYSNYLFGKSLSMGSRVAMEIKEAIESNREKIILT